MKAKRHFHEGRLDDAIAAATDDVKRSPTDLEARGFLAELLCFAGNLERADAQLDVLAHQDPQLAAGIAAFRHVLRSAEARQQFYDEGRLPEFVDTPTAALRLALEASICLREGNSAEAAALLERADAQRPEASGVCNGAPFSGMRDLDDLTAGLFEVFTGNGKYYWVPIERIERLEFHAPKRPRDLLWRRAHLSIHEGPAGEVFIPALYAVDEDGADDGARLGRLTDWSGGDGAPVRGRGLRTFLLGGDARTIMELETIEIAPGESAVPAASDLAGG